MEMVSQDYESLDHYNKEYETIDTPDTQRQVAGAYNIATCEAYGIKNSISTPEDGHDYDMYPAYLNVTTTSISEQRGASLQSRVTSTEGLEHGQAETTKEEDGN